MKKALTFLGLQSIFNKSPWGRFFISILVISAMAIIGLMIFAWSMINGSELRNTITAQFPDDLVFTIENGTAQASGVKLPYILSNDSDEVLGIIDTTQVASAGLLNSYSADTVAVIASDALAVRRSSGEIRILPYPEDLNLELEKSTLPDTLDQMLDTAGVHFLSIAVMMFIFGTFILSMILVTSYLFAAFIVALLASVYNSFAKKGFEFEEIFNAVLIVTPVVMLIDVILGFLGYGKFIFTLLALAVVVINMYQEVTKEIDSLVIESEE